MLSWENIDESLKGIVQNRPWLSYDEFDFYL